MDKINYKTVFEEALNEIIGLLAIPSVYDEKSSSAAMPYGSEVCKAFAYMKQIAIRDGFEVREYDGHALSISCGRGERIDIASHLDVVAADPKEFDIRIEGRKLIGRGTSDMKVPMFLTYLALKLLKERHPDLIREMRIVLGGDEERTMNDMRYYVSKEGLPAFAFTPDGYFPMGISEKGAIMWTLAGDYQGRIVSFNGGTQCNIIPDQASCELQGREDFDKLQAYILHCGYDAFVRFKEENIILECKGKAAHASMPAHGHSATVDLLDILAHVCKDERCRQLHAIFSDSYGRNIDSFAGEELNACLSLNLGILNICAGKLSAQIDCRYPYGMTAAELTEKLRSRTDLQVELPYNDDPTRCEEDDPYVAAMLATYRRITGDDSECITSSGVSYTKVFKHCVSFGPNFPGEVSPAHQKGEYIDLDQCVRMLEIYYETIKELAFLEV